VSSKDTPNRAEPSAHITLLANTFFAFSL